MLQILGIIRVCFRMIGFRIGGGGTGEGAFDVNAPGCPPLGHAVLKTGNDELGISIQDHL